ncbi:PQ-loop-domain-containing protein [Ganoderma leucocontextum]|nr:PQ-loop-domain-containing protein [Ganoderma leucocontextum]
MPANPVAENVFGTIGTICWTVQLVPQVWKSWRSKSTDGLSEHLMLLWGISCVFIGVYAIVKNLNVPLIVQPQIMSALSYLSWAQCQYYGRKRSKRAVILMGLTLTMVSGGFEAGMIFAVRPAFNRGNTAPVTFVGIVSTVLLSCGLLPQYYEIHKYKEVVGVSLMFMFVDMMGGVFSAMSLAFKERFDVVAGVAYSLVVVLDGIVLLCALILNPRAKRRRKELEAIVAEEQAEPAPAEQETTAMRDVEAPPSTDQVDDKPQVDSGKIASDIEMTVMDMSLKLLTRSYPSRLDTTWREAPD